jgi:hypothetical protein
VELTPTGCEQTAECQGFPLFSIAVSQCAQDLQNMPEEDRAVILQMVKRLKETAARPPRLASGKRGVAEVG